jgi:hypothetical protein
MTKTFCDRCGCEATKPYQDTSMQLVSGKKFQLRAIFELVTEPSPCGSLGLSSSTTTSADICATCQVLLLDVLKTNIKAPL